MSGDNDPRFPWARGGRVESWFWRANHPTERRAFWLKATVRVPADGSAGVAELWFVGFRDGRAWGRRATVPLGEASFGADGIEVAGARFTFGSGAVGALGGDTWKLAWQADDRFGPLCVFPWRWMVDGGFPRSKLLTPLPVLRFSGEVGWGGIVEPIDGWIGMQGHNWGREHAREYAWGQVVFPAVDGSPGVMAEGYTARVKVAGMTTPRLSALVVVRDGREYRFDRTFDPWAQEAEVGDLAWSLRLRGHDGEATLTMVAAQPETACLRYDNPDGTPAYCFNSKLARAELTVRPINEDAFSCVSPHGAALELLRPEPDPRWTEVV